jgi:hypothetical protein
MAAGSGTEQLKHGELYRTGALQQGFRHARRRHGAVVCALRERRLQRQPTTERTALAARL